MKEIIMTGKTVELAIEEACRELGVSRDNIDFEIIDMPKKGFLGLKSYPAKVRVTVQEDKAAVAVAYVESILRAMGATTFTLESSQEGENLNITLKGEDLGFVIGRRGETIDAIQYLAGLAVNRLEGDYLRITIDSGNFREKREKTLESLARRLARNVVKSGRSVTLEPMNPYERRIIHSTVATVEGATSASTGEEPNRRVVISSLNPVKKPAGAYKGRRKPPYGAGNSPRGKSSYRSPRPEGEEGIRNEGEQRPFVFRPNTNTRSEVLRAKENRRNRPEGRRERPEEGRAPSQPRTEVPRSEAPKEAAELPLFGKIDLE